MRDEIFFSSPYLLKIDTIGVIMLDIRFIRENAELVQLNAKQKNYDVDIPSF